MNLLLFLEVSRSIDRFVLVRVMGWSVNTGVADPVGLVGSDRIRVFWLEPDPCLVKSGIRIRLHSGLLVGAGSVFG